MKASISLLIAALTAGVVADLHTTGVCIDQKGADVYNRAATEKACAAYKKRNTGNEQWDQCPDCTLKNERDLLYYCESAGKHIGGDELHYYCTQNGAADSVAW
ncbi:hypothetical protein ETB97_010612 [Aspergillus alliaceus]|uniref:Uncharacterized protein n=1 Tax=Petromyces alliaceus TaxID=209559 RepID=A0A5N6FCH3_PETAA|nr:uncharacterized protein BDW43DRAFT_316672 [Aspergillus alliaceus]KAB8227621.1 hypothetical protein BDW43DRAFT_316672 [Aspergillus alliaceus]KAE8384548.1 hypothetical protein BDV23DRAFT_189109 [Aspergillus alliaceus]KAF5854933.1 hypothetical protein ETB97_010612 [Aspergillus burnettii]